MGRPKKEKVEKLTTLPHDPVQQKKVKDAIEEIVNAKVRMAAERDLIKDIGTEIEETVNFSKKVLNKMAAIQYKSNRDQVEGETQEVLDNYDVLFPTKALES